MALPGMPKLLKKTAKAVTLTVLGKILSAAWNYLFPGPQWGVFEVGSSKRAIEVSCVESLDISAESRVSNYPLQTGSFTSYNKVRLPNSFRILLIKDGAQGGRQEFLQWLQDNAEAETIFDVVCPEFRWASVTLAAYTIPRSAESGAGMIRAECTFEQIKQIPVEYSSSKITDPKNQPTTPTTRVNPVANRPNSAGGSVSWA